MNRHTHTYDKCGHRRTGRQLHGHQGSFQLHVVLTLLPVPVTRYMASGRLQTAAQKVQHYSRVQYAVHVSYCNLYVACSMYHLAFIHSGVTLVSAELCALGLCALWR